MDVGPYIPIQRDGFWKRNVFADPFRFVKHTAKSNVLTLCRSVNVYTVMAPEILSKFNHL